MGQGLFATALQQSNPLLPLEEEGRLNDAGIHNNFMERVFAYHRWQQLIATGLTTARLIDFHARHKLILMAHGNTHYSTLGRIIAAAGKGSINKRGGEYIAQFMDALSHRATRKRHTNVLQHLMGYLKKVLDHEDKAELLELIHAYRLGTITRIAPLTLLRHHFRRHPNTYITGQYYLYPDPRELLLAKS